MADRLIQMRVLVTTVKHGSFAAASEALGMSPQMAGRHIRMLEDDIGARLLERTTRRSRLTEVGARYYAHARHALAAVTAADESVQALTSQPRGTLRIAAPTTFGSLCLTPLVTGFMQRYPAVNVDLVLDDRVADLVGEGFDVAIRIGALRDSSLIARPLAPYDYIACAAPAYLERHGRPQAPSDLIDHRCLTFSYAIKPPDAAWRFEKDGQTVRAPVRSCLQVNDLRALREAAVAGLGVLLVPRSAVGNELHSGALRPVLADFEAPSRAMHILYPHRETLPKVARFVDEVMRAFGPDSPADPA